MEKFTAHMLLLFKKLAAQGLSITKLFRDIRSWFGTNKYERCSTKVLPKKIDKHQDFLLCYINELNKRRDKDI